MVKSLKGSFEESVIAYLFLLNILPILIIPMMWLETGKFTEVLNNWTEFEVRSLICYFENFVHFTPSFFQVLYYKVSGRILPLNIQTKALLIAILLPALSAFSVIITHLTMAEFKLFQVPKRSTLFKLQDCKYNFTVFVFRSFHIAFWII